MIAQKYRFHGHGSLRYLYRHGDVVRTRTLTVRHLHNPRRKLPRFTVIVAKKVLKKAVKRNYMRRRVYEVIREFLPYVRGSHDVAITVFSADLLELPYGELREQIVAILQKAEVIQLPKADNNNSSDQAS